VRIRAYPGLSGIWDCLAILLSSCRVGLILGVLFCLSFFSVIELGSAKLLSNFRQQKYQDYDQHSKDSKYF